MKHKRDESGFHLTIILLVVVVLAVVGFVGWYVWHNHKTSSPGQSVSASSGSASSGSWTYGGQALIGDNMAADPDVVALGNGQYRMYYGRSLGNGTPKPGQTFPILSAISTGGKTYKPESGVRITEGAFPDVVHLKNGHWRMYYQSGQNIVSATSTDGLNWTKEPGVRISTADNAGVNIDQVGAPTTMQQANGTFTMVYAGYIQKKYNSQVPNQETHLFLWATSKDGLNFTVKGIALDSRNSTYQGWLDGPDWSNWSGKWRLYFWSYAGIYYTNFNGSSFSGGGLAYAGQNASKNSMAKFQPNPPGDPTLIQIGSTWYMYYDTMVGSNDLIYYATQQGG